MNHNRLSEIFLELTHAELRDLSKYLQSPLFNQQEILVELFEYMRKRRDRGWKNENIFKHLFPEASFNIKKIHQLNSALFKQIESFLAWREWQMNKTQQDLSLLRAYRKKHLDKHFIRTFNRLESHMESKALRNEGYHRLKYQLQQEQFHHHRERGRTVEFNLQELSNAQDIHYISDKLKHACTILSHQAMYKIEYDQGLLQQVIQQLRFKLDYLKLPAIAVYYHAFHALFDLRDESSFAELKKLLYSSIKKFNDSEQRDIYILAINYCIRRLNTGDKQFMRVVFELYQNGLKDEVFIENKILSRWTYNNIIIAGLKLKEFDWVEWFIYEYKNSLDEKTGEDSFYFNLAKFYFEKRDYKKAMPLLIQTKYDDLLHNLGAKTMLSKMYYELQEWSALDHLLDSFKVYISRKKDIGYHKENYMNIINFIKKLTQINSYDKKAIEILKSNIAATKILTEREWILEQLG